MNDSEIIDVRRFIHHAFFYSDSNSARKTLEIILK